MEANQWLLPVVKMTASGSPECFRFSVQDLTPSLSQRIINPPQ